MRRRKLNPKKIYQEHLNFILRIADEYKNRKLEIPEDLREDISSLLMLADDHCTTLLDIYRDYDPNRLT